MAEKVPMMPLYQPNRSHIRFKWSSIVLILLIALAIILLWRIDIRDARRFIRLWSSHQQFLLHDPAQDPKPDPTWDPTRLSWISVHSEPNYTANFLSQLWRPVGVPCVDSPTVDIVLPLIDGQDSLELPAGEIREFIFHTLDESNNPRCAGGDYFETDLFGERWRSRAPLKDLKNGSYSFSLQVHPDFAGDYNFTLILLFRGFQGLKFSSQKFTIDKQIRRVSIKFYKREFKLPELRLCSKSDFDRDQWSGRWTRLAQNDACNISNDGRYRCLGDDLACLKPWCEGNLASLESNGWVYSAHCSFRIFSRDLAWNCLKNRWIFFWGDSNHVDTIRNMLNFILGVSVESVPRRFDLNFTNPENLNESVRITNIFNGHWNDTMNYKGLESLQDVGFRRLLEGYFGGVRVPDVMIMNSGLHDGLHFRRVEKFCDAAEFAANFWARVLDGVRRRGLPMPDFVYRTTVATGGTGRRLGYNPSKMEVFNGIFMEKMRDKGLVSGVVDGFDMTYAWHFDHRCSDGVHYGRSPAKTRWKDGEIGHQYFVDVMLGHVLLNRICVR